MKVHLVDGTFELFRCFHGAPQYQNKDGEEVGAVRGLLHTLLSLLKSADVSHVAVAFDQLPAPRGAAVAGTDAGLMVRRQGAQALAAVRALGITLWPMVRYQADDALASGARLFESVAGVDQVVICTSDTDLFQCIRDRRVITLNRITKRETDENTFRAQYGIAPGAFPDWLALVGLSAKGIPGVPGWGRKAAARLLDSYGSIEAIPAESTAWSVEVRGARRLASALADGRDEALLVKRLATLRDDLPLDAELETVRWRTVRHPALEALIVRCEADDLRARLLRWDAFAP